MPELTAIVREQTATTRQLLQQISLRQSPSAYYDDLLKFLGDLCNRVDNELEGVSSFLEGISQPEEAIEQTLQQLLVLSSHVLREIHYYCESFDHAERLSIPTSIMQLLNKLAKDITQEKPFILRGTLQFNYMYYPIGRQLNRLANSIPGLASDMDDNFATLSFPLANSRNILANCALIHEFSHLVVDSLGLVQELGRLLLPETRRRVTNVIQVHAHIGDQADFEIMNRINAINEVLENWIHESLADTIGLHLIGLAHFFNFLYCIQPLHSHQMDDTQHPCDSYRIKSMIDGVENLGWQDILREETPAVLERAQRIYQIPRQVGLDFRYDAATECLLLIGQTIFDVARNVCREAVYRPDTFLSCKENMFALLERGIPPAEILNSETGTFHQFDVVSILNSGWLFYEKGFPTWEERFSHLNSVEQGELLNRLLAKAIEISFVKEASNIIAGEG